MAIWDFLTQSDSNLKAVEDKPSSKILAQRSQEPASEAYVDEEIGRHRKTCSIARVVRRWSMLLLIVVGAGWASQWWYNRAQPAMLEAAIRKATPELIRGVVRDELSKVGIVQDDGWPHLLPKAFAAKGVSP